MKKVLEGYFQACWEDTGVHPNPNIGMKPDLLLHKEFIEFDGKKVRITIEEIEDDDYELGATGGD